MTNLIKNRFLMTCFDHQVNWLDGLFSFLDGQNTSKSSFLMANTIKKGFFMACFGHQENEFFYGLFSFLDGQKTSKCSFCMVNTIKK
uniref:Uncharacterized protein n=1 Tax=Cucumis melo subsp. melo TaxID=412675 RepID=E5GCE8_CUCME|nr:hypothetical protein [Cucumis melo subsp. melo]